MLNSNLNDQQRAFLLVSYLADKDNIQDFLSYLSDADKSQLNDGLDDFLSEARSHTKAFITHELKALTQKNKINIISDIHPDWIYKALEKESPRMIATILRYLPGQTVQAVLNQLPATILEKLPRFSETFSLDTHLVQLLHQLFEDHFRHHQPESSIKSLNMQTLVYLSSDKLTILFRELGFKEIAMAFQTLHEKTVKVLLTRLRVQDSEILKEKINLLRELKPTRLKMAQNHLLALDIEQTPSFDLVMEMGFFIYSKALLSEHLDGVKVVCQKFSTQLSDKITKYIDKNLNINTPATVERYQNEIVQMAHKLFLA